MTLFRSGLIIVFKLKLVCQFDMIKGSMKRLGLILMIILVFLTPFYKKVFAQVPTPTPTRTTGIIYIDDATKGENPVVENRILWPFGVRE